ncbi:myosin-I heavy chain [Colias croceus]|uniref:myosin-I heavy chain n=1 Tax=Colias crocea TaxID=72248 RepID=UPI001E27CCAA|nr:myosin-I heavy chain [Colias croceus]
MEEDKDEGPGVPDMTMMPLITEDAINDNLRRRYKHDLIYTYTGSILVAVNPYKELGCYNFEDMQNYRGKAFGSLSPHVFALAESAYSSLQNGEKNQSVVISGESGAGKTETTKLILQYLCAAGGQASWAEQQILEANTVLEAFGNAKTVRNDNSSRFGKFVEVRLDHRGGIKGAVLRDFLLERARITGPAPRETNYHVFYQLVEGARHNAELKATLRLRDDIRFKYLLEEREEAPVRSEPGRLEALQLALTVLQVPPHMCEGLFKVLAAVLWLGNVQFQDIDGERTTLAPEDAEAVDAVANLLGLAPPTAQRVLLERQINVRGNVTDIPFRLHEARENRHAMARALYSRTFAWLVRHVNSCSAPGREAKRALGVLDIFGFENFASNSLEQLCINYANEKLHMFFNNYVFALEQEIYRQEGIKYNQIQFTDNAACLELLEKPPRSLLKLLSEQCHMPKGSDSAYLTNIQSEFGEHQTFVKGSRRKWEEEFGVQHYAGTVTYSVQGFVDKNRDTQQDAFIDHLSRSANPFVRELADYVQDLAPPGQDVSLSSPGSTSTTQRGTSKGRPTVVDTFRAQLQSLVDMLQVTDVWYVRCIKPNEHKVAGKYNEQLVLEQLRYLGMNEIVRIRRDGYPVHLSAPLFCARYRCLLPHPRPRDPDVTAIMELVNAPKDDWQIGHTKIFMRSSVHGPLEARRSALLQSSALLIQKWYKGSIARRQYVQWRKAAVVLQAAWRGWFERAAFLRLRRAALTLQRHLRGAFAREVAAALREMKRVNQEIKLREERNSLAEKAEQERAELESMADQLRGISCSGARAESVNLDNLFDFLADVPAQRGAPDGQPAHQPTINEIGDSIERLADDLNQELEHVLAEEMNELTKHTDAQRKPDGAPSEFIPPPPPNSLPLHSILHPATPTSNHSNGIVNGTPDNMTSSMTNGEMTSSLTLPPPPSCGPALDSPPFPPPPPCSLPEPAGPPPPPPLKDTTPPELTNGIIPNGKLMVIKDKEPIYESVIPRPPSEPPVLSPPPPPPPFNPPESNGISSKEEPEPEAPLPPLPSAVTSPEQAETPSTAMDSSCISPPPMLNGDANNTERSARRKERVERRLHQLETTPASTEAPADSSDLTEFAKLYFNDHPRSPEGTIMATLTRKSKSMELLTKEEMITYHKGNNIPTSHIQLHDPDSVTAAVNIFRDLCRYMRGELTSEKETQVIQSIIGKGLEREELRDEILVQCVRQITECPVEEWAERVWLILCLCAVAWQPSRGLARYYCAWLRARARPLSSPGGGSMTSVGSVTSSARASHCAQWCLDNCRGAAPRQLPPSTVEIAAMRRLGTIVCRFFFLDGRTKAIDVHPADTAAAAAARLADKLGLPPNARAGWAVYQQRASMEEHVRATQYLYDVIAAWEMQQGPGGGSADNRFVFKRRLFRGGRELPHDPVEVALLYAQAVHSVVKMDEFPVSEKVALQLAGLQAQVSLGEPAASPPPPHTRAYYSHPEQFLPPRIAKTRPAHQWATILAQAHRQYGAGRAELTAKALYLSCVMQYPLYGVTLFPVTYKGYWAHGPNVMLGVGSEGVVLVRPADKVVLAEYPYSNIAAILMDPVDNGLTLSLTHHGQHDGLRCIVLECAQKQEAAWLMAAYSPTLANSLSEEPPRRAAPASERTRLAAALRSARRALVDCGLLRRPPDLSAGGFLRNTLRRLSKHRLERVRLDLSAESQGECYKGFPAAYWCWARSLPHSLTKLNEAEEVAAMQIFKDIMSHAGLSSNEGSSSNLASNSSVSSHESDSDDRVALAQALLQRCLQKDTLLTELYMQLIKQVRQQQQLASNSSVSSHESDSDDRVALAQALLQRCLQKDTLLTELYMQLIKQVRQQQQLASNSSVSSHESDSDDRVALAQALLQRCLQKDTLLTELYMQLIKQVRQQQQLASNSSVSSHESDSDDRVALAQALLQRCLQKDTLLTELYMQLIKQVRQQQQLASNSSVSSHESDSDDRVALAQALLQRCLQKDTLLTELYMQLIKQVRQQQQLASNSSVSSHESDSDDRVALAQALLQRCLQKDTLLTELYMQLIKQTTEHPEPSSRVSARHWALLCAAVGAALPPAKPLRRLLLAHLRYRAAALHTGEEGKFARRAEQVALSIAQVPRRLTAPSKEELLCAGARRPMHVRVLLLDGKQHGLVFGPAATADHLVAMLREKIGLTDTATGYALYEVCANSSPAGTGERALGGAERVGDVLARWEKAGATAAACRLVFKKRLFLGDRPLHSACVAEMELLYYQLLHAVRHDRLPIETDEAVMVAALHAQVVKGECSGGAECAAAAGAVLPARLVPALPAPAVRLHHLALRGTPPHAAMQRALTLAASWPLARATIFDVMQSFTSNWPRALWLAVDARGLTLLRRGARAALVSHDHDQLLAVSPAPRALLLVTRADKKHAKLVLSTDQAYQIATLIKDYIEAVRGPVCPAVPQPAGAAPPAS